MWHDFVLTTTDYKVIQPIGHQYDEKSRNLQDSQNWNVLTKQLICPILFYGLVSRDSSGSCPAGFRFFYQRIFPLKGMFQIVY